jgi:hypothetical protein
VTQGWNASETVEAAARVRILAEKSSDLSQPLMSAVARIFHSYIAGELSTAAALANESFEVARREGNPTAMAYLYYMQLLVRHHRGDLLGVENHFAAGQEFFDDPVFRHAPTNPIITVFGWASWNAWALGRTDLARERLAEVRAAVRPANPYDLAWSNRLEAALYLFTREYEMAEASWQRVPWISAKNIDSLMMLLVREFPLVMRERSSAATLRVLHLSVKE